MAKNKKNKRGAKSGEKKEMVRKEKCVEKMGKNLNFFAKSSDLKMLIFLNCL
jgi:hypothetical protein